VKNTKSCKNKALDFSYLLAVCSVPKRDWNRRNRSHWGVWIRRGDWR